MSFNNHDKDDPIGRKFGQKKEQKPSIDDEFQKLKNAYFKAREEYNACRRNENSDKQTLLDVAEQYGHAKALFFDFKEKNQNLITVNR